MYTCVLRGFHVVGVSSDGNLIWNTCPVFEASPAANSDRGKKVGDAETDEYWLQRLTSLEAVFCLGISSKRECKTILAWLVYFRKSVSPLTFCKRNRTPSICRKVLAKKRQLMNCKKGLRVEPLDRAITVSASLNMDSTNHWDKVPPTIVNSTTTP